MLSISGSIELTQDQIEIVKDWNVENESNKNRVFDFEIHFKEMGIDFNLYLTNHAYAGETIFGLPKSVFSTVKKNQKFIPVGFGINDPADPNNWIKENTAGSFVFSNANNLWFETEKEWKDRVYDRLLLSKRLLGCISTYVATKEEALDYGSRLQGEYFKPITIKMILEYLQDDVLTKETHEWLDKVIGLKNQMKAELKLIQAKIEKDHQDLQVNQI